ncbi:MAG: hypothetical protein QOF48_173 [Verrucomicrobiota bacterium]|jgi:hypothetical protein
MNKMVFLDWDGPERTFNFVGWNAGRAAGRFLDSTAFVLDDKGRHLALQLRLPFLKPAFYQRDPFPPHAPTRIERFRLLPPPCRRSQAEADDFLAFVKGGRAGVKFAGGHFTPPAVWEAIYGGILFPTPKDEPELEATMKHWLEAQGHEYKQRKAGLANLEGKERDDEERTIEEVYNMPRLGCAGLLHTTLALVKSSNAGGIRDYVLQQRWAKEHRLDLRDMAQDKEALLRRWRELTEVGVDVRPTKHGTLSRRIQNWDGWHDKEQELLALVTYRIHFADSRRYWLSGCQLRDLQTVEEKRELDELLSARGTETPAPSALEALPNDGFVTVKQATELLGRSDRWLRDECKNRGWRSTELSLGKVEDLRACLKKEFFLARQYA